MLGDISEVSILVSALLAVAVGSIWYSPLVCGMFLSRTTPHAFDDTDESRRVLIRHVINGVLVQIIFLVCVAKLMLVRAEESITLFHLGVVLTSLLLAHTLSIAILEKRSMVYFLVHAGYTAIILFGGLVIIAKWPW